MFTLKFGRFGNYIDVTADFDKTHDGGFGQLRMHVHAADWGTLIKELSAFDSRTVGLMRDIDMKVL